MASNGPDFIIPGASKSGTTSLYHYLDEHEDIFIPERKEVHFFDRDTNYNRGIDHYESYFADERGTSISGDITPSYFYNNIVYKRRSHASYQWQPNDDVPARIHKHYPDIKLIFTLRNPIKRAYSQFQKNYRQGRERADSFTKAIREELNGERTPQSDPSCWVYRNRYPEHIGRWFDLFDREQIRVIVFEEWVEDTEATLNDTCRFIGVEPLDSWSRSDEKKNVGGQPRIVALNRIYQDYIQGTLCGKAMQKLRVTHALDKLNSSDGYPKLSDEARTLLTNEFEAEFHELEDILGRDLDVWRSELA